MAKHKPFINIHPADMVAEEIAEYFYLHMQMNQFKPWELEAIRRVARKATPILRTEATALHNVFGQSTRYWLKLQKNYDEREAGK